MARWMIGATVLWLWCLPAALAELMSALEVLQFQENMKAGYRLSSEDCKRDDGIPLAIGLMRENPTIAAKNMDKKQRKGTEDEEGLEAAVEKKGESNDGNGWGGAYYTMSYLHPQVPSNSGKLEIGTFSKLSMPDDAAAADSIDARVVCLRRDMQYVFKLSRNPNKFEIGALVGRSDFLGPEDSLHITTWDGEYKSRIRRHKVDLLGREIFSHVYYYAPQYRKPTLSPTPYPTWSRSPTRKPTSVREAGQSQVCLEGIPSYDSTWTLNDYCNLYKTSAGCTAAKVASFSCVPSYLSDPVSCGSTFCHTFSLLASGVCDGPQSPSLARSNSTLLADVGEKCLSAFVDQSYNTSELSNVNWQLTMAIRGVNSSDLSSNDGSKKAIRLAVARFMPGVPLSSITLETIEKIEITHSPTRSPSTVKNTQKSALPTFAPNDYRYGNVPKPYLSPDQLKDIYKNFLRWHSKPPSKYPTPDPKNWTPFPSPSPMPIQTTLPTKRTRPPSPAPSTPAPAFPKHSKLNETGVLVSLTVTCKVQSMGFGDEQAAYSDALINLKNAASSQALTVALKDSATATNGTAVRYGVVLGRDVVLTSLGTLPPSVTPIKSTTEQADTGLIAGTAAAAVGAVGVGGAVAYKMLSASKDVVKVVPLEQLASGMDGVALQSF